MRLQFLCWTAVGLVAVASFESKAIAGETFICNDGRMLQVSAANREKVKDDPCVAEWYRKDRSRLDAGVEPREKSKPTRVVTKQGHATYVPPSRSMQNVERLTRRYAR